ncbi:hypothetical protein PRIPAC_88007 [Pristionchus pacificus]|uniref:Uncharacterized protein n=1 Tax=Pristionchus pacificus TaxID=54126 RepID=A0A2A6B5R3_PRIPA|nr:hypothetical protein PRIPAC_88007 [Pristionchus pacificus]|eukprot:PDM61216.1 hypothetical protein PRIPAC_50658 [Pristionchus pacificus]
MRFKSLLFFAFLISAVCAGDSSQTKSEEERDRLLAVEKERVWPMLRGCCEKSEVCPDKSDIRNYFKCKEELGRCLGLMKGAWDLQGDAVDGCDLIYAEKDINRSNRVF